MPNQFIHNNFPKTAIWLITLVLAVNLHAQTINWQWQDSTMIAQCQLMGSRFTFTAVHADSTQARKGIEAGIEEVHRIEEKISSWLPHSETSMVNRAAGLDTVEVSDEWMALFQRSLKVAALTHGAFDPSFAGFDQVYSFDGRVTTLPDAALIQKALQTVGWQKIQVLEAPNRIWLPIAGMKIGFGAIGKGYAADRAKKKLLESGIQSGIVNAGGDLICWGNQPESDQGWAIAISNPQKRDTALAWINVKDQAVVTSGNYEKFILVDGEKYSHIIDPRTGYPIKGVQSVTIICPSAELADALATGVSVLGAQKGLDLVNSLTGIEGLVIEELPQIQTSNNLNLYYVKPKP